MRPSWRSCSIAISFSTRRASACAFSPLRSVSSTAVVASILAISCFARLSFSAYPMLPRDWASATSMRACDEAASWALRPRKAKYSEPSLSWRVG